MHTKKCSLCALLVALNTYQHQQPDISLVTLVQNVPSNCQVGPNEVQNENNVGVAQFHFL